MHLDETSTASPKTNPAAPSAPGAVDTAAWNPAQYLKFKAQRTQPAIDLARRIPLTSPARILDIGCGPGNSTRVLRERFPQADILDVEQRAIDDRRRPRRRGKCGLALRALRCVTGFCTFTTNLSCSFVRAGIQ